MRVARLGERRGHLLVRRHVDLAENPADLARDFLSALPVSVEHRDLGTAPCELARSRLAEARCGAGHDRGHSIDVHFNPNPSAVRAAYSLERRPRQGGRADRIGSSQFRHGPCDKPTVHRECSLDRE